MTETGPKTMDSYSHGLTHDGVLELIRRNLAGELDVDPATITDETRFKEDLEVDSLDVYSLVQELEDTYGTKMSDEKAAEMFTVGQSIDFVLAHTTASVCAR